MKASLICEALKGGHADKVTKYYIQQMLYATKNIYCETYPPSYTQTIVICNNHDFPNIDRTILLLKLLAVALL